MSSPFFGLDIATRALRTQQTLVDITNQNIANANTPGYSRQSGTVEATLAYPIPVFSSSGQPGQLGTGVEVTAVTRARDTFADMQIRGQYAEQGRWDSRKDALAQVEATVNEPSSSGLSSQLTKFWQSWQQLANSPSDAAARVSVVQQGTALAQAFNSQSQQLRQEQQNLDGNLGLTVTNINNFANQIAVINKQISQVEAGGMHANDLRDQRDQLLDQLSQLVKVTSTESADGQVSLYVNGHQLVDRDKVHQLVATPGPAPSWTAITWADDNTTLNQATAGGQLQGLAEARDTDVQNQLNSLDQLAKRVIQNVNSIHTSGVGLDGKGGQVFFDGTDSGSIAVDSVLTGPGGTDHVAAARVYADPTSPTGYSTATGDSSNAVALANLQQGVGQVATTSGVQVGNTYTGPPSANVVGVDLSQAGPNASLALAVSGTTVTINGASATVTEGADANGKEVVTIDGQNARLTLSANTPAYTPGALASILSNLNGKTLASQPTPSTIGAQYGQAVASLGVASSTAQSESSNQQVLVNQLDTQRQQTSGVSLDEEATHLIQYQRAYEAAARVITVNDSMLDTLINHTGAA
ncbi:MAG: flagellar hook-associated protein FlgK [Chloroflexi bacterium]|nr:flagellar hook-associated protein FlgK [Chloroflexota bacterium]MBV9896616.1 flagellar hook-associated protein FlgK [Chloroflexota bacterium]